MWRRKRRCDMTWIRKMEISVRVCIWLEGLNDSLVRTPPLWIRNLALATALMLSRSSKYSYVTWISPLPPPKCYLTRQPLVIPSHEWRWVTPAETWRCGLSQGWGTRICTACIYMQTGVTFNETCICVTFYCRYHCKRRLLSTVYGIESILTSKWFLR
jgi:hypothetical protein